MKRRRGVVAVALVICMLALTWGNIPGVEGDLTSDLKAAQKKLDALKSQLQAIQKLITQNKSAKYELLSQLTALNEQMDQLQGDMGDIDSRITELERLLGTTGAQIAAREKQYAQLSSETEGTVELLYHVSNLDVAGLAFAGGDLNSVVNAQQGVSAVLRQITASLDAVSTQKLALESDRAAYASTKAQLEEVYALKKQQADLLQQQTAAKQQTLNYLAAKGSSYAADNKRIQDEIARENKLIDQIVAEIYRQQHPGAEPTGKLLWPIPGTIHITELFGMRNDPINGVREMHNGIDMGCPMSTPVRAPADGTVEYEGRFSGYGNMLMLQCGQHMTLVFGHLKSFVVKKGASVKQGQTIALSDNTGWSTGPHLHFEVRIDGTPKNPFNYLGPKP